MADYDDSMHGLWVRVHRTGHVGRVAYRDHLGVHVVYEPTGSMGSRAKPTAGYCDFDELTFLSIERKPFWSRLISQQ